MINYILTPKTAEQRIFLITFVFKSNHKVYGRYLFETVDIVDGFCLDDCITSIVANKIKDLEIIDFILVTDIDGYAIRQKAFTLEKEIIISLKPISNKFDENKVI